MTQNKDVTGWLLALINNGFILQSGSFTAVNITSSTIYFSVSYKTKNYTWLQRYTNSNSYELAITEHTTTYFKTGTTAGAGDYKYFSFGI